MRDPSRRLYRSRWPIMTRHTTILGKGTAMTKRFAFLAGGLLAIVAVSVIAGQKAAAPPRQGDATQAGGTQADEPSRDADREAIRESSREFSRAFEKRDAKAVAALWTQQGEYQDETGDVVHGRAAIEKAFADVFKE